MTIVEKAAYLKGLAEGLGVSPETKEGKLWAALNDLLSDMAHEIEDLQSDHLDMADALDQMSDDLSMLEEYCCDLDMSPLEDDEDEDELEDEDEEDDEEEDPYDGVLYDVTCPSCGEEITLDEDMLAVGSIDCPHCGEALEFDLSETSEDGEDELKF
ncbi:MAG: zinc-ribbon domain-containing protein [Oscillospiraceae bacterium]|nr:zinc-ribbon domain-containing protein [Oscillospiraceae bacterium]